MSAFGKSVVIVAVLSAFGHGAWAKSPAESKLEEVYSVIRTKLAGIDRDQFEKDAIRSLLRRTGGDAELVHKRQANIGPLLEPSKVYEQSYGYLRIRNVEAGLAEAIENGVQSLQPKGDLGGLMLDLRFAQGRDYQAAVIAANKFLSADRTQLVVGEQHLRTIETDTPITGPIIVLVNGETRGAAEALVAILQRNRVGLVIGTRTAARTKVFFEFPLRDGDKLRVATGEVKFVDGSPVSGQGLSPDIPVNVKLDAERVFFDNAYATPAGRKQRRRINEAQLVRQLEQKLNPGQNIGKAKEIETAKEMFDPVLGR
ncbi:MAG: S41 family peptidase, partial [Limisphaerales bacterium]